MILIFICNTNWCKRSSAGVMSKDGDYLIDPDKDKNVQITYAGASIYYVNKNKRYADQLKIIGPTQAKLRIMVRIKNY